MYIFVWLNMIYIYFFAGSFLWETIWLKVTKAKRRLHLLKLKAWLKSHSSFTHWVLHYICRCHVLQILVEQCTAHLTHHIKGFARYFSEETANLNSLIPVLMVVIILDSLHYITLQI